MCSALAYVRFVPIADIPLFSEATKVTPRPYLSAAQSAKNVVHKKGRHDGGPTLSLHYDTISQRKLS